MSPARAPAPEQQVRRFIAGLSIAVVCAVLLYYGWLYREARRDGNRRSAVQVPVHVDSATDVSEIGYISEWRSEIHFSDKQQWIIWFVKIPATDKLYSCEWEYGFAGFKRDDAVTLIRLSPTDDGSSCVGYIVGLHGSKKGRVAQVNVNDTEFMW
jgi:hypothetical protein